MVNDNRDPRAYELMSVFIPDMPDEDTQAAIERVNGFITSEGGEVKETLTDSPWGRRRLAYTMRFNNVDFRDGYYVVTHFDAAPNAISGIERELKLDTQVIRYLLVMDDPKAGEKDTGQHEESTDQEAPAGEAEETTQAADTAPVADTEQAADTPDTETVEAAPETAEATSTETDNAAPDSEAAPDNEVATPEAATEAEVAEVAEKIEGEEAPAPADGPTAHRTAASKLPDEGEGSDWVSGDGTNNVPDGFSIKGNASSKIYHPIESPNYNNTIAEIYFATPEAAERFGYRLPKTLQHAAEAAANSAANLARAAADAASEEE